MTDLPLPKPQPARAVESAEIFVSKLRAHSLIKNMARLVEQRDAQVRALLEARIVMLERQVEAALNQRDDANERAQRAEEERNNFHAQAHRGELYESCGFASCIARRRKAAQPPRAGEARRDE